MYLRNFKFLLTFTFLLSFSFAQEDFDLGDDEKSSTSENQKFSISGKVTNESGAALAGANIVVDETDIGSASDESGEFTLEDVVMGSSVTVSVIGYEDQSTYIDSEDPLEFVMVMTTVEFNELEVLASRASENTAVAYSDVDKEEIELRLGAQDIPLAMNLIPSVYATNQGGH